jgi:hypothetical protein
MKEIFNSAELDNFTIRYKEQELRIRRLELAQMVIYQITFPGKTPPLIVTRARKAEGEKFWTSVPEGRQKEAEAIGPLIGEYILSKQ